MKKLIIISNQAYSLINFRGDLLKLLSSKKYQIFCFAPDFNKNMKDEITKIGCTPIDYKLNRSSVNPFTEAINCINLYFLIKKIRPEIVFSYSIKPVIYGSLISYLLKIPNVYSLIEGLGYVFTNTNPKRISLNYFVRKIVILLYKYSLRYNKKVFFLNKSDIHEFQTKKLVSVDQTQFLDGIGLNLDYFKYKKLDTNIRTYTFLFIGRLLKEKGVYEFIESARKLKKEYQNIQFMVVGNTDKNPGTIPLEEVENWENEGVIKWIKFARDVRPYIEQASVFVLPSYYREGLPRVIQEAMAIGRPIITCDSVGCRETVENGRNGFLVKTKNIDDLISKMKKFIFNPELIQKMGFESRIMAQKRFDVRTINNKIYNIISSQHSHKKNKIFIISNQSFSLINFRLSLMELLKKNKLDVYALAPDFNNEYFIQLNKKNINFINYKLNRSSINPLTNLYNFFSLYFLIKKNRPDIILSYSIKPVIYGSLISFLLKIPRSFSLIEGLGYIFTFNLNNSVYQNNLFRNLLKLIVIKMYQISLPYNDKIFFLNKSDINEFLEKKLVNTNQAKFLDGIGLDLKHFSMSVPDINKKNINFLFMGRLLKEKGVYEFIEAAKKLKKKFINVTFTIVGSTDKNPGSIPINEIRKWEKNGFIEWTQFTRDVRPFLHNSSVFVLPSYREGLSRSIQEAMAIGRAIITCDTIGCRETVENGENGYLVKVQDPSDLAEKMKIFVENKKLIKQMGFKSRLMAEKRFDHNEINKKFLGHLSLINE